MDRKIFHYVLFFFFCFFVGLLEAEAGGRLVRDYVPGEVLIKFKSSFTAKWEKSQIRSYVLSEVGKQGLMADYKRHFSLLNVHQLRITDKNLTTEEVIRRLRSSSSVEYVEPNYIRRASYIPNDSSFSDLWGLHNTGQTGGTVDADIDMVEAWDIHRDASNVVIVVLDSGVDYGHEDLAENMWRNPGEIAGNGIDDDGNGYIDDVYGINAVANDGDPIDDNGHGTHVAGILGAVGDNTKGVVGVCPKVKIMALKFLDARGSGTLADELECLQYIISMKTRPANPVDIRVVNMSFGSSSFSQSEQDAIANLRNKGILVVAAAGNEANDNDANPSYPASYTLDNIIAVAATDDKDGLASFSNFGSNSVDVAAPGADILSTKPRPVNYTPQSGDIFFDNMEGGTGNWANIQAPWQVTTEQNHTSGGSKSWSDSPNGNYNNNQNISFESKAIDLSGQTGEIAIGFWIKGSLEVNKDYLYLEVSKDNGASWIIIGVITGSIPNWINKAFLVPVSYFVSNFKFRFRLFTDSQNTDDGVYIDDVGIGSASRGGSLYENESGTSMATPYVAGLAALIISYKSSLSYQQVRSLILDSVDKKDTLSGKVSTGGRVNAWNAFLALQPTQVQNPLTQPFSGILGGVSPGGSGGGGCTLVRDEFVVEGVWWAAMPYLLLLFGMAIWRRRREEV